MRSLPQPRPLRRALVTAGCGGVVLALAACGASPASHAVRRPVPATTAAETAPATSSPPAATTTPSPTAHRTAAHRTTAPRVTASRTTAAAPVTVAATTAPPTPAPTATRASTPPPATASAFRYHFPADGCAVSYGAYHHDYPATDISAPRGCHFVAVVSGRVDEVSYSDTWHSSTNLGAARGGLSVSIVGDDGVRYYGSHLERIAAGIAPAVQVRAGELLGYVGNSGDARGIAPQIHFGISWPTAAGMWWVRRGELSPYDYLRAWQSGRTSASPRAAVERLRRSLDGDPHCRVDC